MIPTVPHSAENGRPISLPASPQSRTGPHNAPVLDAAGQIRAPRSRPAHGGSAGRSSPPVRQTARSHTPNLPAAEPQHPEPCATAIKQEQGGRDDTLARTVRSRSRSRRPAGAFQGHGWPALLSGRRAAGLVRERAMTPIAQQPADARNATWACRPQPAAVTVRAFSYVVNSASARPVASTPTAPSRRLTAVAAVATPTHKGPQPSPMTNPETGCVIDARIPEKVSDTCQCQPVCVL
jgi:hypothetical protein